MSQTDPSCPKWSTRIQITALDAIVNVNSIFTLAVFIGLAWNPTDRTNSLISDPTCLPSAKMAEDLVSFHVFSFSSFLFSSLIALCLKQAIRFAREESFHGPLRAHINKHALRLGMLVSAVGSVFGCLFLMLALIDVVQIKLGKLSCGNSPDSWKAVVPLVIFVPAGLITYIGFVLYAFTR